MELDIEILCGPYALFMQDFSNDGEVNLSDLFFLLTLLFAPAAVEATGTEMGWLIS